MCSTCNFNQVSNPGKVIQGAGDCDGLALAGGEEELFVTRQLSHLDSYSLSSCLSFVCSPAAGGLEQPLWEVEGITGHISDVLRVSPYYPPSLFSQPACYSARLVAEIGHEGKIRIHRF